MSASHLQTLGTIKKTRKDLMLNYVESIKKALETQSQLLVPSESMAPLVIRREIRDQVKEF